MSKHIVIDARIRRTSTGRYTHMLVEKLQAIDTTNKYTVLVEADDTWRMTNKNFTTQKAPYKQFSFSVREQLAFARQLYSPKADVYHFTMTQFPLLFFNKNIVVTTHDLGMLKTQRPAKYGRLKYTVMKLGYTYLLWACHRKASKIIVPSDWVKKDLSSYQSFTANKIIRTYESGNTQSSVKAKKPKGIQPNFILYQGTPFPHKNVKKLVDAFDILHADNKDLHLHFNGKIEQYYKDLQQYIATKSSRSNIHLNGFVPDEESKWMFNNCLAYVTPTLDEGFGITGLEAMEQGAPVVCSDIPILREVYGNAPEYFNPHSAKDIATKIKKVATDSKLRKAMKARGLTQAKKYTWEKMAQETLAVYSNLIK